MDKTDILNSPGDDASYEAEIDHYIIEMQRLQQHMVEDRKEIEFLQAETRAILADIMTTLKVA